MRRALSILPRLTRENASQVFSRAGVSALTASSSVITTRREGIRNSPAYVSFIEPEQKMSAPGFVQFARFSTQSEAPQPAQPKVSSASGVKKLLDIPIEDLTNATVFVRVDFNVSYDKVRDEATGKTTYTVSHDSSARILESLPTIRHLIDCGAKVVLASHLSDPGKKGITIDSPPEARAPYSLAPVAQALSGLLQTEVKMAPDCIGPETAEMVAKLQPGQVLLLENVRFHAGEQANDPKFAQAIQDTVKATAFVNDAFGTAHRAHASVIGVAPLIQGHRAAGVLMAKELKYLDGIFQTPRKEGDGPIGALLGGAKVSSKLPVITHLLNRVQTLAIGGAMALPFVRASGYCAGVCEEPEEATEIARQVLAQSKEKNVNLILPVDYVVASSFSENPDDVKVVAATEIPPNYYALDIGPKTCELISDAFANCSAVVWNGPVGRFEWPKFATGTKSVIHILSQLPCATVAGGGETSTAIEQLREPGVLEPSFTHVSTGGGASLEVLKGKTLPALKVLDKV